MIPQIAITSKQSGSEPVRVEIIDNGIGIPAGHHEAIFNNFHRAHRAAGYAGTGLGLAICKRIVERPRRHDRSLGRPGRRLTVHLHAAPVDAGLG